VTASYDTLIDVFECIENFLKRLMIYTEFPPTPAMTEMLVKIMAELLGVLALATKQIHQGRFSKFPTVDNCLCLNTWQRNMQRDCLAKKR
jgi:hypothetical protein